MAFQSSASDDYLSDIKLEQGSLLSDSVSCIDWSVSAPDHFACTLWDGTLKIYQVHKPHMQIGLRSESCIKEKASIPVTTPYPLTYCTWSPDGNVIFLGTSKGEVKALDTNSGNVIDVAKHPVAINYIKFLPDFGNTLLTSAYEHNVHFWSMNSQNPVKSVTFSKKIYRASFNGDVLATGMADEKIGLVNIKALHKRREYDSSELGKYSQIQSINVSKNGKNFGLGTIDGRVNVSYIHTNPVMELSWVFFFLFKKTHITFKAHKTEEGNIMTLYPVNTFTFHPIEDSWFSTSGADGTMHYWNHAQKNKIKSFNYNSNPVCCASVSYGGNYVAYALGNDWHMGPEGEKWRPKIAVH